MRSIARLPIAVLAAALTIAMSASLLADPLPGEVLKFQQKPMDGVVINGVPYWGHDEDSAAWSSPDSLGIFQGNFMADDFSDKVSQAVVHVKWWGSYPLVPGEVQPPQPPVQTFLIGFEHDIPADPSDPESFSMPDSTNPGNVYQIVTRVAQGPTAPGTFTEALVPNLLRQAEDLYEYNAELNIPFPEQADTVYWLKIVALRMPSEGAWGWHNRDYTVQDMLASGVVLPGEHFDGAIPDPNDPNHLTPIWHHQDDAVTGLTQITLTTASPLEIVQQVRGITHYQDFVDGPGPMQLPSGLVWPGIFEHSKDLAFELYGVPEPSAALLVAIGAACLLAGMRKQRNG